MKIGAKIGFLLRVLSEFCRAFSTAPTDPEGNAGLGDLPSLPVPARWVPPSLPVVSRIGCVFGWMACDGLTPHLVGVIMSCSRLQPRTDELERCSCYLSTQMK